MERQEKGKCSHHPQKSAHSDTHDQPSNHPLAAPPKPLARRPDPLRISARALVHADSSRAARERKRHVPRPAEAATLQRVLDGSDPGAVFGAEQTLPFLSQRAVQVADGADVCACQCRDDSRVDDKSEDREGGWEQHGGDVARVSAGVFGACA